MQAATSEWLVPEEEAVLELLRGAADFLSEATAGTLIERLITDDALFERSSFRVLDALSQVVQVASREVTDDVARKLREWIDARPDPLVAASAGRALRRLAWEDLSPDERREWIDFVDQHIGESSDLAAVAQSAALGLAQVSAKGIIRILTTAYRETSNLAFAAVLADLDSHVGMRTLRSIQAELIHMLNSIRADAEQGRYSAYGIDFALLANWVAKQTEDPGMWEVLVEFILDPKVAASHKTSAMDALAETEIPLPRTVLRKLRARLQASTAYTGPLFGPWETFEAARLRLGLRLEVVPDEEAVASLISMARGNATQKVEALRTIEASRLRDSTDVVATLTVTLVGDMNQDVAGYAARVLGSLASKVSRPLHDVIYRVLDSSLQSQGSVVRRGALEGLRRAPMSARLFRGAVRGRVRRLAESDLSFSVRWAASRVIERHTK